MHVENEDTRKTFEEKVYADYFISQVMRDEKIGWLRPSAGTRTKAELLARDSKGHYTDSHVSAMWYGWNIALASALKSAAYNGVPLKLS